MQRKFMDAMDRAEAAEARVAELTKAEPTSGGVPCVCRFRTFEGDVRHGSETGELVDPDVPIRECALHKALREHVAELAEHLDKTVSVAADAITRAEAAEAERDRFKLEVEQCHAKSTCCCGDYMKQHSDYSGHSPVSMYDYVLDGAETRAHAAETRGASLAGALEACEKWIVEELEAEGVASEEYETVINARAALAATPAEVMERAKLGKALIQASDAVIDSGRRLRSGPVSHELTLADLCAVVGQIAKLDALGKEGP